MEYDHNSRLVTLGENLAALVETSSLLAITAGSLARAIVTAPFREPARPCGCGGGAVRHHYRCCYDPPIHRCGGW